MVGEFTGRNGHGYKVEFLGSGVSDKRIDIVSATISMAANERKFVGFKSTTAQIRLLSNSPMVEL